MNPVVKRVYDGLPASLQNLVVSGFGWWLDRNRYGGRFPEYRALLEESQWWSPARLRDWQDERLRAVVAQAFAQVPF